eukprot:1522760-Amphidinium_carterae.1
MRGLLAQSASGDVLSTGNCSESVPIQKRPQKRFESGPDVPWFCFVTFQEIVLLKKHSLRHLLQLQLVRHVLEHNAFQDFSHGLLPSRDVHELSGDFREVGTWEADSVVALKKNSDAGQLSTVHPKLYTQNDFTNDYNTGNKEQNIVL